MSGGGAGGCVIALVGRSQADVLATVLERERGH